MTQKDPLKSILVLNSGSSTIKAAVFQKDHEQPIWKMHVDWEKDFEIVLKRTLQGLPKVNIAAIGHRVVHGGEIFKKTTHIDKKVKKQIADLSFLAPLHNPINLLGIEACEKLFSNIVQFAAFDTAFHTTLKQQAYTYPLPYTCREQSIRRYGFHGISHSYCTKKCASFLKIPLTHLKIVICHLGAGSSLCAVKEGKSIDTTMGMTPLEGLMMATRCGSIDPGILLYLLKEKKYSVEGLEEMLNLESGLLGISGISGDMKAIEKAALKKNERAILSLEIFVHRLISCLGSMIATLGGLDVLVFTAGIGENSAYIREKTCDHFAFLGLGLDPDKNQLISQDPREISSKQSTIKVLVIPTREEWEIAQQCFSKYHNGHDSPSEGYE